MGNCINKNHISEETRNNAKPFIPEITEGAVVKVYDSNAITIITTLPYKESKYYRFSIRLLGIDSAEKDETRDALSAKILGKTITLRNVETNKYGQLQANVYLDGECINDWMLKNGHAVTYDAGKKTH
jgi:endonuclease YncB( thermonuclease family)